jgi:hypothetical protein
MAGFPLWMTGGQASIGSPEASRKQKLEHLSFVKTASWIGERGTSRLQNEGFVYEFSFLAHPPSLEMLSLPGSFWGRQQ